MLRRQVLWVDVKANIVVEFVAAPSKNIQREIHETPFQLMECDRGAQCSYHCAFAFDSCGSTQFHPTRMMSDWYDLMSRSLKATPVDETQKGWVNLSRRQATRLDQDRPQQQVKEAMCGV